MNNTVFAEHPIIHLGTQFIVHRLWTLHSLYHILVFARHPIICHIQCSNWRVRQPKSAQRKCTAAQPVNGEQCLYHNAAKWVSGSLKCLAKYSAMCTFQSVQCTSGEVAYWIQLYCSRALCMRTAAREGSHVVGNFISNVTIIAITVSKTSIEILVTITF